MTPSEAQAELERGLASITDFDEAAAWLAANTEVANSLCPASLLLDFAGITMNSHEAGQD